MGHQGAMISSHSIAAMLLKFFHSLYSLVAFLRALFACHEELCFLLCHFNEITSCEV